MMLYLQKARGIPLAFTMYTIGVIISHSSILLTIPVAFLYTKSLLISIRRGGRPRPPVNPHKTFRDVEGAIPYIDF